MRKPSKPLSLLLCLIMILSLLTGIPVTASATGTPTGYWSSYASAAVAGTDYAVDGSGNYTIYTAVGLAYLAKLVNGTYATISVLVDVVYKNFIVSGGGNNDFHGKTVTLAADIDLGAHYWVPIGQFHFGPDGQQSSVGIMENAFWGTFDGRGHYIDGLTIGGSDYSSGSGATNEANGLFGLNMGTIKNVGVRNMDIDTYRRGAGIAGINYGTVEFCMSSGTIDANGGGGTRGTGGIVGSNYGLVYGCYSSAHIYNAYRRAGGIVGYNTTGTYNPDYYGPAGTAPGSPNVTSTGVIDHCYFTGHAESANATYSGSIACTNDTGVIRDCYYLHDSAKDAQDRGCPVGYAGISSAFEFNSSGQITGDDSKNLLTEISAACNYIAGTGQYPALFWETGTYDFSTAYTVGISETTNGSYTVTKADGTPVTSGQAFTAGTLLKLSATPAADYILNYFTADGAGMHGSTNGTTYIVSKNITLGAVFKYNMAATLSLPASDTLTVHVVDMHGKELFDGDKVYVGDSFKVSATLNKGAFPEDAGKHYSGTFTFPFPREVLSVEKVSWDSDGSPKAHYTYTLNAVEPGDALDFSKVTPNAAPKAWLDNDYGVTWYDTSWYTGDRNEYTLTTAAQLAGLSWLTNNVTSFEGVTIRLGADIELSNPDGTGTTRFWVPIGCPGSGYYLRFTGVTAENFNEYLAKGTTSSSGNYLTYYDASGSIKTTDKYINGISDYYYRPYFSGTFDGQSHTVDIVNTESSGYRGLFGYLNNAAVRNVTIAGTINSGGNSGAVAGGADHSVIQGCVNTAALSGTGAYTGGIVGYIYDTTVSGCSNYGSATFSGGSTGNSNGGIVGYMMSGRVENCANRADFVANATYVGGIVGSIGSKTGYAGNSTVASCYNTGRIAPTPGTASTTYGMYGGIVAQANNSAGRVLIEKCWNSGNIAPQSTNSYTGGILGNGDTLVYKTSTPYIIYDITVDSCYNTGTITDNRVVGGKYVGGIVGRAIGDTATDSGTGTVYNALVTVSNCYNTGAVTQPSTTTNAAYAGSILGSGQNALFRVTDSYYLTGTHANGIGTVTPSGFGTAAVPKTIEELKTATTGPDDILTLLGGAYAADTGNFNSGYPVISGNTSVNNVYSVSCPYALVNGAVASTASGAVPAGTHVILNVRPDAGYRPAAVTASYVYSVQAPFTITPVNGVYSFAMPDDYLTVSAAFEAIPRHSVAVDGNVTGGTLTAGVYTNIYTGEMSDALSSVASGTKIIVVPQSKYGYTLQAVSYSPAGGGTPVSVTARNGVYSFQLPDYDVTVSAVFTANNHALLTFENAALTDTQLGAYASAYTFTRAGSSTEYVCEGIYVRDILGHYVTLKSSATMLTFFSSDGASSSQVTLGELAAAGGGGRNAMLAWKVNGTAQPLQIVLQDTAGARWISGIDTVLSNATGSSGGGDSYTVTGYSGPNGSVTPSVTTAEAGETIALTAAPAAGFGLSALTVSGAALGQAVSCNTNTYTFVMPGRNVTISAAFESLLLKLYSQNGADGAPVPAAVFTQTEIYNIMDHNSAGWAYLYYKNDSWSAIVATDVVSIDTLFNAGGIGPYWKSGSYLSFLCSDGVYTKAYPDYDEIKTCKYYVNGSSYQEVPAGMAVIWESGSLDGSSYADILAHVRYGSLRFVYGVSQETYTEKSAAGARSPYGVMEMTVVYDADSIPTGTVGTTHETGQDAGTVTVDATVTETTDGQGNVTVQASVTAAAMDAALKDLPAGAALEVDATSAGGTAKGATVTLPRSGVQAASDKNAGLILKTDFGTIAFDSAALAGMAGAAGTGEVSITISNVTDGGGMNNEQRSAAGGNTVIRLEATDNGGTSVGHFGSGSATVTISYTGSDGNAVVKVYRINDDGTLTDMDATYSDGEASWDTGSFSYYMIAEEATEPFDDVSPGDWFYDAVNFVYGRGLFSGVTETTFAPDMTMTRAMLVTVLYRLEGKPAVTGGSPFADVSDASAYYYGAVVWATQNDIVSGYSDSVFGADDPITREQMVTILYRYAQYKGCDVTAADSLAAFTDAGGVGGWASAAVKWAVAAGILKGTGETTINPDGAATRAQVAAILQRFCEDFVK